MNIIKVALIICNSDPFQPFSTDIVQMNPNPRSLIFEGKAKKIFSLENSNEVLVEFKNDATAFNAAKHQLFEGKGRLNCLISSCLFELLESKGISTHYLGLVSENVMAAKKVKIIPLEVVVRNIAAGSLCKETPVETGSEIKPALLDLYYKDDSLGDPFLSEARIKYLNLVNETELSKLKKLAIDVNSVLQVFFDQLDILLVDFKLEIGVNITGELLVSDEISPDTCRLWDKRVKDSNDRILDKDRFRKDLGGMIDSYSEIYKRVQGATSKPRLYS